MEPYDDDYRQLIEDARDALEELCRAGESHEWLGARGTLYHLKLVLDHDDQKRARVASRTPERWHTPERDPAWDAWKAMSRWKRMDLILLVLDDKRLTAGAIAARLNTDECHVSRDAIWPTIKEMVDAGELVREETTPHGRQKRWAFRRNTTISPDLTELEQALEDR